MSPTFCRCAAARAGRIWDDARDPRGASDRPSPFRPGEAGGAVLAHRQHDPRRENLALRKKLAAHIERSNKPRRSDHADRVSLSVLARLFSWRDAIVIVRPATFIRWHRLGWRIFDDHLDQIAGNRDQLVGRIQEAYGIRKDEAERQVDDWETSNEDMIAHGRGGAGSTRR